MCFFALQRSHYAIGDTIILVLSSRNLVGKKINIDLNDKDADFEYKGTKLVNDKLNDYLVNNNTEKIELTVIEQQ